MDRKFVATPFRPVFSQLSGQPPVPWERWFAVFEDWLLAIGFPAGDEHVIRKAALLRASLGTEGYRVYASLTSDMRESYDNAVQHISDHFGRNS